MACPINSCVPLWTDDGIITWPSTKNILIYGLEFHPESIMTEHCARHAEKLLGGVRYTAPPYGRFSAACCDNRPRTIL
jgi:hypothetical protein